MVILRNIYVNNGKYKFFFGCVTIGVMEIKKLSGDREPFSSEKLCRSLKKVGLDAGQAQQICTLVESKLKPGDTTTKIFRHALRSVAQTNLQATVRYSLRRAVDSLGPSGFLFEKYVEALLQAHGYTTKQGSFMKGECATHEVDVYAEKGDLKYLVEAKYRNSHNIKTHIDQVMYADARLMDIQRRAVAENRDPDEYTMWVITNTQFTTSAIKYAECRGVKLVSWNYPKGDDLESMIIRKKMYPITVLPSLTQVARDRFAQHKMILAQDLVPHTVDDLVHSIGISKTLARKLLREAQEIISF